MRFANSHFEAIIQEMESSHKPAFSRADYYLYSFWLGFAWLAFFMALTGFFRREVLITYLLVWLIFWLKTGQPKSWLNKLMNFCSSLNGLFLAVAIALTLFVTPTIFSGRDQGAISEAAIRLSDNRHLAFSTPASQDFFNIYGSGKALNFPGFHYMTDGQLTTQFPLPYIAWLAAFYAFAGLNGLIAANAVLFFLFLRIFRGLAGQYIEQRRYLNWLMTLTLTSFSFIWINKFTLSENLALPLVCLLILSLTALLHRHSRSNYALFLATGGLLVFTRIEGIFLFAVSLAILAFNRPTRRFILKEKIRNILIPAAALTSLIALNTYRSIFFYKEIFKAILPGNSAQPFSWIGYFGGLAEDIQIFFSYGLLGFFVLGAIGIILLLRAKKYRLSIPFLVIAPTFIYLIAPNISADHPWMLRRFVFSLLPIFLLYSLIFIEHWPSAKRKMKTIILLLLLCLNLPASVYFLTFSENRHLAPQLQALSGFFPRNERVLVDRLATGDPWSMASGPLNLLNGVDAVYFFNPADINKPGWNNSRPTMLIVSQENLRTYLDSEIGSQLKPVTDYSLTTTRLGTERRWLLWSFPARESMTVHGQIFKLIDPQQPSSCSI